MTAEEIAKLMEENSISIHDIASCLNCTVWVWSVDDFIIRVQEYNYKFGKEMTDEQVREVAQEVCDRLEFSDYGDLYEIIDFAADELIYEIVEEKENENGNQN